MFRGWTLELKQVFWMGLWVLLAFLWKRRKGHLSWQLGKKSLDSRQKAIWLRLLIQGVSRVEILVLLMRIKNSGWIKNIRSSSGWATAAPNKVKSKSAFFTVTELWLLLCPWCLPLHLCNLKRFKRKMIRGEAEDTWFPKWTEVLPSLQPLQHQKES